MARRRWVRVTVALGAGGVGYGAAQQAATDHDRLARVEADMADVHDDIAAISRDLTQIREDVAAIRARLHTGREAEEE